MTLPAKKKPVREVLDNIFRYTVFVATNFPFFYVILLLTLLALTFEYLASSLMIPLSSAEGTTTASSSIQHFWVHLVGLLSLPPTPRTWLWLFIVFFLARISLGYFLATLITHLSKKVHETLSGKIFKHVILNEPMHQIYSRSIGHYITMAGDDTFKCGTIISSLLQTFVGLLTSIVGFVILYQYSSTVFLFMLGFLAIVGVISTIEIRSLVQVNLRANELSRELNTTFVETLNSIRSIRSLHSERFLVDTYGAQIHRYVRMLRNIDIIKNSLKTLPVIGVLIAASYFLRPQTEVSLPVETLLAGTVILTRVFVSLGQMLNSGLQTVTEIRAVKDINSLVRLAEEGNQSTITSSPQSINSIALSNVSFGYSPASTVLDRLSFRFEKGKVYAIVGASGSGKSTLADLLMGLSKPRDGSIVFNDGQFPLGKSRPNIILVEQQPKIYSTTIRENLLLGYKAPDNTLVDALGMVDLTQMLTSLEHGLDTRINYLGENFSGGQRQRIGIARALVRSPQVLILDEATSALDSSTRNTVLKNLRQKMKDGIVLFITHDPEIESIADEVCRIN